MAKTPRTARAMKEYVDSQVTSQLIANGGSIKDDASKELIKFTKVSSAVNEVNISNNSAGNAPIIAVTGDDTNIGLVINQKAAAPITLGTTSCTGVKLGVDQALLDSSENQLVKFVKTSSAVNEVTITNAATGNAPSLSATGDNTNIDVTIKGKGTGAVNLGQATSAGVVLVADQPICDSAGLELIAFTKVSTAVNELNVSNNSTGLGPVLKATGETNVPITVAGKGTGIVRIGQSTTGGVCLVADQAILDSSDKELLKFSKASTAVNELTIGNAATGASPTLAATGDDTDIDITLTVKGAGYINAANLNITHGQATHDYAAGAADWTLSATELKASTLYVTNANGAANIIAPSTAGKRYFVVNASGQTITIKKTAGTGIAVANGKSALVEYIGSDYLRLTADATSSS